MANEKAVELPTRLICRLSDEEITMENPAKSREQRRGQPNPRLGYDDAETPEFRADVLASTTNETIDAREEIEGRRRGAKFRRTRSASIISARAAARQDLDGEQDVARSG